MPVNEAVGGHVSQHHLEAVIASWHTQKVDTFEKWDNILQTYDLLLQRENSPVAAVNRIYALAKLRGPRVAIQAAEHLPLEDNHLYHTLLGELYSELEAEQSSKHFMEALCLAKTEQDKWIIRKKLRRVGARTKGSAH